MKKLVTVTVEHQIEVEIEDALITPERLTDFSQSMWPVDLTDIFKYAGRMIAQEDDATFIDGLGYASFVGTQVEGPTGKKAPIKFKFELQDIDVTVADI